MSPVDSRDLHFVESDREDAALCSLGKFCPLLEAHHQGPANALYREPPSQPSTPIIPPTSTPSRLAHRGREHGVASSGLQVSGLCAGSIVVVLDVAAYAILKSGRVHG